MTLTMLIAAGAVAVAVLTAIALAAVAGRHRRAHHRLHTRLQSDPLTMLPNRAALTSHLAGLARTGCGYTLCLLNLDRFAYLNLHAGYRTGDELLVLAAARLAHAAQACRQTRVFKLVGDEYAITTTTTDSAELLARLREAVTGTYELHTCGHQITTRIAATAGAATSPRYARLPAATMLRRADQALQAAKRHHRNTISIWQPHLDTLPLTRHRRIRTAQT
ncbi:diguanylate cyclase domain-containing protein [Catelliglobosispora koreensis]|uniref:diguanylate cyclase domain-containing protein n=1 Tax=Catelliglobosispora koreensis TaxID=129052 RepID=UPI00039E8451|nr:diguanylate cyclase [Catelliglobosispora koreensis]